MTKSPLFGLASLFIFAACGQPGEVGDECEVNADCAEGLECHLHEHDGEESDHGDCEEHDDDEDMGDDTGEGTGEDDHDHE